MRHTVKLSAVLRDPAGTWEKTGDTVDIPNPKLASALLYHLLGVLVGSGGLTRDLGDNEIELIPMHRVVTLTAKASAVGLADGGEQAALNAEKLGIMSSGR